MTWISLATVASALGAGLVAGTFFAFSSFVMPSLARLPARDGLAAMNSINQVILGSPFMLVFVGTALLSVILGVVALTGWRQPGSSWLLVGAGLYLIGSFLVTIFGNVPLNDALAAAKPDAATEIWQGYLGTWTLWNYVRTGASLLATLGFIIALGR